VRRFAIVDNIGGYDKADGIELGAKSVKVTTCIYFKVYTLCQRNSNGRSAKVRFPGVHIFTPTFFDLQGKNLAVIGWKTRLLN